MRGACLAETSVCTRLMPFFFPGVFAGASVGLAVGDVVNSGVRVLAGDGVTTGSICVIAFDGADAADGIGGVCFSDPVMSDTPGVSAIY